MLLNNPINTCLISLNIILYYSEPLNTCECLICQTYQQYCNQLKKPIKDTSLNSVALNPLNMLPKLS